MNQFVDDDTKKTLSPTEIPQEILSQQATLDIPSDVNSSSTQDKSEDGSMKKRRASDNEDEEMRDPMDAETTKDRDAAMGGDGDDIEGQSNPARPSLMSDKGEDGEDNDGEESLTAGSIRSGRPSSSSSSSSYPPVTRENSTTNLGYTEASREHLLKEALALGPYVYELYSVLVHRGSALGGHYYAYIKSFESNKWYEFNDSSVTQIDETEVKKTFGDAPQPDNWRGRGGMSSYNYGANAYMLMYRRVAAQNTPTIKKEDVPQELRDRIQDEEIRFKRKAEEKEREREMVTIKLHYEGQEKTLKIHNSTTLAETTRQCGDAFLVLSKYPENCIRIRNYQVR